MNTKSEIQWVLFDMGNVLVDYQPQAMTAVAGFYGVAEAEIAKLYFEEGIAQAVSEGTYSPEQFVEFMNARFKGRATKGQFVEWYSAEVASVLPGIPELVAGLQGCVRLAVLSNTFFGHWDYFLQTPLAAQFECLMASHELGVTKPKALCYELALAQMKARPAEVLFLDDKLENVQGAQHVGIRACLSCSVADTRAALSQLGLV